MSTTLFLILLWWLVWFYGFLTWYEGQKLNGRKHTPSYLELFFMFLLSGLGPLLAICMIIGKGLARCKDREE